MPKRIGPVEDAVIFRFGGGLRTDSPEDEIRERELFNGLNFLIEPETRELRSRPPFDKIGTAPNAAEIRGFICRDPTSGSPDLLVQAGNTVYQLDSSYTFTSRGTVSATAKLRGRIEHNWHLTADKVLITDIALVDPVKQWDGTTLSNITFVKEDGSTAFGTFRAKYLNIANERAIFSNIHDNGTNFHHLIVSSKRGDFTNITVAQRPSSSLSDADPWFLVSPDNRYINGMTEGFGKLVFSTRGGSIHYLAGSTAKDFNVIPLYRRSGGSGDESLVNVGNDIIYGRDGRIESLVSTDQFGDVDADDLSLPIANLMKGFNNWLLVYNQRNQRVYCHPSGKSQLFTLHKSAMHLDISPWGRWKTNHASAFNPTAMMNAYDPADGQEYVFFGDASGNVYRMEGTGVAGDGGTTEINMTATTRVARAPLDADVYDVEGWVIYRRPKVDVAITLDFLYGGETVFNQAFNVTLKAGTASSYWGVGGGAYWGPGGGFYWGAAFSGRRVRQKFPAAGKNNEFQISIGSQTDALVQILEVGVRFKASSA